MNIIRRVVRKPIKVIVFRALQELRLGMKYYSTGWPRIERFIAHWWSAERVQSYATNRRTQPGIVAADSPSALRIAVQHGWLDADELLRLGQSMRDRQFELLGAAVPSQGAFPWHSDWRWGKTWKQAYFRSYDFYSRALEEPSDVRVTWELSRLGFVLPILQNAALEPEGRWIDAAIAIISDWERQNPLAYSVNWYPMEASMRSINLIFALEMLLALGESRTTVLVPLLRLITAHGVFVWRTLEYTDIRGNHYAANLIALLLCGLTLRGWYAEAQRWLDYAVKAIPAEIVLQFLPDGVNVEKSIAYHRLVTELFLVGMIAMERAGWVLNSVVKERIHLACSYTAAYIRPDGLAPNVGDNDDARVLAFDPIPARNHSSLTTVAGAIFDEPALQADTTACASLIWLLGRQGIEASNKLDTSPRSGTQHFREGGVVVVREGDNFLWLDIGEVGLAGRGGHGHNDLLSFELVLQGRPLIVDPGSYVYTGDPVARDLFRSTAYHNGLRIDGIELAPMSGMWSIGNQAIPHDIEIKRLGTVTIIHASHDGYRRLADPVVHTRDIQFAPQAGTFSCTDHLACIGLHKAERYLHLNSTVEIVLGKKHAILSSEDRAWRVRWDGVTKAHVHTGWVSPGYGVRHQANILVLTGAVEGCTTFSYMIEPLVGE
jgi:hypothetical protein